jgi:tRNA(Ile)-lysidine synthase
MSEPWATLVARLRASVEQTCPSALAPPFAAVAWSGGADSTCLLWLWVEALRAKLGPPLPCPVLAIHIDHGLRDDSDADARWCEEQTALFGGDVALSVARIAPRALPRAAGLEEAARAARYAQLGAALRAHGRAGLLTAHHADDNLETLLLALARGSGLAGLAGVRPLIGLDALSGQPQDAGLWVARPCLGLERAHLRAALEARGLGWREDPSNALLDRRRNVVRHLVLPALRQVSDAPSLPLRSAGLLRQERAWVERMASEALTKLRVMPPLGSPVGCVALAREGLGALDEALQAHVIREAARQAGVGYAPAREAVERVLEAAHAPTDEPKRIEGAGVVARVEARRLVVWRAGAAPVPLPQETPLPLGARLAWGDGWIEARLVEPPTPFEPENLGQPLATWGAVETFALSCLRLPLRVRAPRPQERWPWAGGTRAVERFLGDARWPKASRPWLPLVEDSDGQPLWLAPLRRGATPAPAHPHEPALVVRWGWGAYAH